MAGTLKKPKKGEPFRLNVELPGELVVKLDEKIKELETSAEIPGSVITRTDAVKRAIWQFVK